MSQTQTALTNGAAYRTPLWVKAFGLIALILAIMVGIMLLSGGQHGPGMHMPSSALGGNTPAVNVTETPMQHGAQHP